MSTVNFSVPDDVKQAFNQTFKGENKSAIISDLMRKAVDEAKRQKQREKVFRMLTEKRSKRPAVTGKKMAEARIKGRQVSAQG